MQCMKKEEMALTLEKVEHIMQEHKVILNKIKK